MYIYDSRRIFFPTNAPAKSIPIDIKSNSGISSATNVQDAIQYLANDISSAIIELPEEISALSDKDLNHTIDTLNSVIRALKKLQRVANNG